MNFFIETIFLRSISGYEITEVKGRTLKYYQIVSKETTAMQKTACNAGHLPAMQETQVRSLSWEEPLEKEMATHSSTLVWEIPWTEEPGGVQSMGSQELDMT